MGWVLTGRILLPHFSTQKDTGNEIVILHQLAYLFLSPFVVFVLGFSWLGGGLSLCSTFFFLFR